MPKLICIVADNTGLRRMLSFALAMQGIKTVEREDLAGALDARSRHRVDMFIVALAGNNSDLAHLVHRLRSTEAGGAVPVIIISDRDDYEERQMVHRLDHVAWLRKPFRISEIQQVVVNSLAQHGRMPPSSQETGPRRIATGTVTKEGLQK